jgi:hypothetical protein
MSVKTQELLSICEQLPEAKRVEVADFARFLLAHQGDERWEQIIAEAQPRNQTRVTFWNLVYQNSVCERRSFMSRWRRR